MSTFERDNYRWRETYFVLFLSSERPTLEATRAALARLNSRFEFCNPETDEDGRFDSLTLLAPEDFAALDIAYIEGDEVIEQVDQLVEELKPNLEGPEEEAKFAKLERCNARFDVMHFQQIDAASASEEEGDMDEMFDPSALIVVLEALCQLTDGVSVDPQAGAII